MKKAYVVAGSFAAIAVVLAITTTHYSTIMQPVMVASPEMPAQNTPPEAPAEKKEETTQAGRTQEQLTGALDNTAKIAAASPPPAMPAPGLNQVYGQPMAAGSRMAPGVAASSETDSATRTSTAQLSKSVAMPQADRAYGMPYPRPRVETGDRFESFASNAVKQVAQEPVSTFSIDADTSSYSFVRRMLNQNSMPSPDAVRVEEMINYFPYDYALPESKEQPFAPQVAVFQTPWNASTKLMHIGIKGYDVAPAHKPHSNLVFLIDVSGSMNEPDKLPLVKSALKMLVDELNPDDTVGIVTYAGYAGVALPPTKITNKQAILNIIETLGAGGSTAGADGIREAYALAQRHFDKEGVNRVILATDGDFNVGINDPAQLKEFIAKKRESGIFLSILGFGQGNYNDTLMQALAQNGNGAAAYIDTISEARKVLVNEASSTLFPIAKDVKIQVEFNPQMVSQYRLIGYETRLLNREDFNNDKIDAGEVGSGHAVTALYEITPAGQSPQADDLRYQAAAPKMVTGQGAHGNEYAFLKIRYKLPQGSESKLITQPVSAKQESPSLMQAPQDVRFAAAVAAFGQKLRGESSVSNYSYSDIISLAEQSRSRDDFGYRSEFINLVRVAQSLQGSSPQPQPMPMDLR